MKAKIDARIIVSYVLSFILSLVFLAMTSLVAVELGFFSQRTFVNQVGSVYYNAVYEDINRSLRSYTIPTGIDPVVVEGVLSYDAVAADMNGCMNSMFEGTEYTPDVTKLDKKLVENVHAFLTGNGVEIDDEIVESYVEQINDVYVSKIKMPALKIIVKAKNVYDRYYMPAVLGLLALAVIISVVVVMMYKHKHKGLRYVAYASGAAALMGFIVPFGILASGVYRRLLFSPEYFYQLMISYIRNGLMVFVAFAGVWVVFTIILAVLIAVMRKRAIMKHKLT